MSPQQPALYTFSVAEVFTFLFVMVGPLRAIGPFARITAELDDGAARRAALVSALVATGTLLLAALVGGAMMSKWHVSVGALAIAGGLIFLLVALPMLLGAQPPPSAAAKPNGGGGHYAELIGMLVSPYGTASLILFTALSPGSDAEIVAVLIVVMAFTLLGMIFARPLLRRFGVVLQVVGMVFGVLQVALAVQMMIYGARLIAIASFGLRS